METHGRLAGPVPVASLIQPITFMVQQHNETINRRCNEMRRLLSSLEEDVESLRINPDNARQLEVHITLLQREVQSVRRERSELE